MSSNDSADALDLDRDLPTTAEDIAVLDRLRYDRRLTFEQYLECLAALGAPPPGRSRTVMHGPPFDLIG